MAKPEPKPKITELCIGGPLDGKQRASKPDQSVFYTEEMQPLNIGQDMPATPVTTRTTYRRRRLSAGNDEWIFVWTPEEQTTRETLELLLTCYAEGHRYA